MKLNADKEPTVLIVDDDPDLVGWLSLTLGQKGIKIYSATDAFSALYYCRKKHPDLVILDLNLGDHCIQGTEVLWSLKKNPETASIVVLVFTGCRDESVKKLCLDEMGADGYLTKGEAHRIDLAGMIRDWLRMIRVPGAKNDLVSGPLRCDLARGQAQFNARPLPLTPREYNVLVYLARRSPNLTSWEKIARKLWNLKPQGPYLLETPELVEACINHLRFKLGRTASKHLITVPGIGALWTDKSYLAD